ncbi:MAG: glycosyl transferase [Rhodobacteraceae bacterium]|nr:glycosyl transferase [Paracoccaceae bacterium]|tara:strand:+ start:891 stop:1613 length:723 start_codon:yes stop_codon:yes gene_type:complete
MLARSQSKRSGPSPRGAILIPALNEELGIGQHIADIRAAVDLPIWLIDDCSTDHTAQRAAAAGARVISLSARLGAWGATQAGIREAASRRLDYAVTMDADGQHNPKNIAALIQPVIAGECDVVIGSAPERGSNLRRLAWRMMRITSGLTCQDLTSGFRVLNNRALALLSKPRASHLDYQDVGVLLMLEQAGMRMQEVPVVMPPRANGKSRIFNSWLAVASYMAHTLILGAIKRRRPWNQK